MYSLDSPHQEMTKIISKYPTCLLHSTFMTLQQEEAPEKLVVRELKKLHHPQPKKGELTVLQGVTLPPYHHPQELQPNSNQMESSLCFQVLLSPELEVGWKKNYQKSEVSQVMRLWPFRPP